MVHLLLYCRKKCIFERRSNVGICANTQQQIGGDLSANRFTVEYYGSVYEDYDRKYIRSVDCC